VNQATRSATRQERLGAIRDRSSGSHAQDTLVGCVDDNSYGTVLESHVCAQHPRDGRSLP